MQPAIYSRSALALKYNHKTPGSIPSGTIPKRLLLSTRTMRGLSGSVILLRENIPALVDNGWEVTLLCEKYDHTLLCGTELSVARPHGWAVNKNQKLQRFNRLHERMARSGRYNLVISHGETFEQDILHVHNCRHLEYEHIHGGPLRPGAKLAADLQTRQLREQRFKLLVANSQLMKTDLMQRYGLPDNLVEVVYPGHDPRKFHAGVLSEKSQELRAQLGIGKQILIGLITSGKLRQRGADLFIQALAQLPAKLREQTHILIVANEDFAPYRDMALKAGIAERTHFLSPRADVETYYQALDIYINPARIETFGMALLEAMACGKACITTRGKVGAAELFRGEMRDVLMPEASTEALQASLLQLLQSPEQLARHGALCGTAAAPHDWHSNISQHLALYTRLHQHFIRQRSQATAGLSLS